MIYFKPLEFRIDFLIGAFRENSVIIVLIGLSSIVGGIGGWMGVPSIKNRSGCFRIEKDPRSKSIGDLFLSLNL